MIKTINLKQFGSELNTRALASNIFSCEEKNSVLTLDFQGVKTTSPSFCHEMLTILMKDKEAKIKFENVNDDIKTQLSKAKDSL